MGNMELNITFKNIEPTDAIKSYLEKKVKKLSRISQKKIDIKAVLSTEKFRQSVELVINIDGNLIKGEETSEDMYSAIDLVIDKIDRQLKKYREKLKDKKFDSLSVKTTEKSVAPFSKKIVKKENYVVKPLSLEEAALQLETLEQDFIVFKDAESKHASVVYKQKDGNYGWIEIK